MCGIAGILRRKGVLEPRAIRAMCDSLKHRGPDDAGYAFFRATEQHDPVEFGDAAFWHLNPRRPVLDEKREHLSDRAFDLALGHRRLAILDLSYNGHQPMTTPDRRLWVVFNGEIYNYRELRAELEVRGTRFQTKTDTEVLLHLWAQFGAQALPYLDGMFAFALYDDQSKRISLCRDRFGVKPLYYSDTDDALTFASEPKALFASGLVEAEINPSALAQYMTFQNTFGGASMYRGVNLLQPGSCVQWNVESHEAPRVYEFHDWNRAREPFQGTFGEAAEQLGHLFDRAVRRQLVSDVPVGAYLSGGMDSGSITAIAARERDRLPTFTGGFDLTNVSGIELGFDERPEAERLSHLLQTEHYAVVLHAGDMPAVMEQLAWHVDDPRLGMSHQNWYVSKLASRFVRVCLAGAGGDELFGGYPWRYRLALAHPDTDSFDRAYFSYWHRLLPIDELGGIFQRWMRPYLGTTWDAFRAEVDQARKGEGALEEQLVNRALSFEFRTFMPGFLAIEDRMSMAHGMESRVPFLDNDLAEFSWTLPPRFKMEFSALKTPSQHLETAEGKLVLREAMESVLPREFTRLKKQGFSPPDENWFRGPSMNYVRDILLDPKTRGRPWFDHAALNDRLAEHFRGERNHRLLIWSLLSLEWLQRHFVDAE